VRRKFELDTPTNTRSMPTKNDLALKWLLGYERFPSEAKLTYVKLNSQTPCPPRGAVPVNQGCGLEALALSTPGSLLVMAATIPAMWAQSVASFKPSAMPELPWRSGNSMQPIAGFWPTFHMAILTTALHYSRTWLKGLAFVIVFVATVAHATLVVKVDGPKTVGTKTIIPITMKNTFKQKVESARAQVFLMDDKGKVVGQAVKWVIGGTKDKPALAPDAETTFNFVIQTDKPFTTTKLSFTRIILEGGKVVDAASGFEVAK
jgi:hypothetical protein